MIYAQGTSVSYGPEYTGYNVSNLAEKLAPPSPPIPPAFFRWHLLRYGTPGALLIAVALVLFLMLLVRKDFSSALMALIPGAIGTYLIRQAWPPEGGLNMDHYKMLAEEYEVNTRLYKTLWACLDCGHIFQPRG